LLAAQPGLLAETKPIETLAQRYAARLMADRPAAREATLRTDPPPALGPNAALSSPPADFAEPAFRWRQPSWRNARKVDIASLQLTRPRSVGVEAVGLAAIGWIGLTPVLQSLGFNGVQRAAVAASVIGRMAAPGSDLVRHRPAADPPWMKLVRRRCCRYHV
jgi:hypothetical protein